MKRKILAYIILTPVLAFLTIAAAFFLISYWKFLLGVIGIFLTVGAVGWALEEVLG